MFTHLGDYKIDGQMQHHDERQFVMLGDEPLELSGTDTTPGPVEALMVAVGTCIAATTNANAALMGVKLNQLEVALESVVDLHGMFGLADHVRPGIAEMRANIRIAGEADAETVRQIAQQGFRSSPVRDSVDNDMTIKSDIQVVD
ncbi:MAG: OsmC family protein [Anaerolineae bacterium]|nr:OsmC family protein [Anaerolineae bacterium]